MKIIILSLTSILLIFNCAYSQQDTIDKNRSLPVIDINTVPDSAFEKGIISIKFKKEIAYSLKTQLEKTSTGISLFGINQIDELNKTYQVRNAQRSFETVLKNTRKNALHKAAGLDLWYQLEFATSVNIKKIISEYAKLTHIVDIVEPVYKKEIIGNTSANHTVDFITNDIRFKDQWHYSNTGQNGGVVGNDIRLPAAWDIEKGKPDVVVAIVDQGMQITHPDLVQNMWSGIGYNFVSNTTIIDAGAHGTHTGGTVGAVSNNGIGVSGIAGGDGTIGSGVRLMTCEVFGPGTAAKNFGAAFIWSADNGAAISQNSWGYTTPLVYEKSVLTAIDYFIANGGGTVMKGGLVIFASGNSNSELFYFPAAYRNVISVSATNNKDARSYYSNYGTWVSISAPGGEQSGGGDPRGVLSTYPTNSYAYIQGTSMACPHVSGVAALILSHARNRLSPDDIKSILLNTTDNHYPSNLAIFAGKLGTGRLNAFKALQKTNDIATAPLINPVTNYNLSINCPNITIGWTNNATNDSVMVAYSATGNFGIPTGVYAVGDAMAGGGIVKYIGNGASYNELISKDSALFYYKIWTVRAGSYSLGQIKSIVTPYTISNFTGLAGINDVLLNWTKVCPNSDVIIANNGNQTFGKPVGLLNTGDTIAGGGKIIYKGPGNSFTHTTPLAGKNFYRIWPINTGNIYSFSKSITLCIGAVASPLSESFETTIFPPTGWSVINPDNNLTWERSAVAAKTGTASARINFWNYDNVDEQDYLLSPSIDATNFDTVQVSFSRAYRKYDNSLIDFNDTLMLQLSNDCGVSFPVTAWKKGGVDLVTNAATITTNWTPAASDWVTDTINLKPFIMPGTKTFLLSFTGKNAFGQNVHIDNVNIKVTRIGSRDAAISKVIDPFFRTCSRSVSPSIELANPGTDTITSLKIFYTLNNTATDSTFWTGILPPKKSINYAFKPIALTAAGDYNFKFYISTPNGLFDQQTNNDTLTLTTTVFDPLPGPIKQGFEQPVFPPANWSLKASNSKYSWQRNTASSTEGIAAAWMRNHIYNGNGAQEDLYSPLIQLNNPDSIFVVFDVAHVNAKYPDSVGVMPDTLEVLLTKDCGKTFTAVYKKWGSALQTVNDPNFAGIYGQDDSIAFVPKDKSHWRKDSVNLTSLIAPNSNFNIVFRNINNHGNNTFLDNINIRPVILPLKLKQQGYMISPNPTNGLVYVQHYLPAINLKALQVINTSGQTIWQQQYTSNAPTNIAVDLIGFTKGVYVFRLVYADKVVTQRVMKIN